MGRRSLSVLSASTAVEAVNGKDKTRSSIKGDQQDLGTDGDGDKLDDGKTDASGESEGMVTRGRASKARTGGSLAGGTVSDELTAGRINPGQYSSRSRKRVGRV